MWTILEYSLGQPPTHLTGWPHLWGQSSMYVVTVALLVIMNWDNRGVLSSDSRWFALFIFVSMANIVLGVTGAPCRRN